MTRRELVRRMGNDELMEWLAFDRIHPLPDPYWIGAMIAFTFARVMGAKGTKFEDYLPTRGKPRQQTGAQMASIIRGVVEAQRRGR
jgi:hypothetical protein